MNAFEQHVQSIENSSRGPWSDRAFDCAQCPQAGCPAWWSEKWHKADDTGVVTERLVEGCGLRLAHGMFVRLLASQHGIEHALEQRTNEIAAKQDAHTDGVKATLRGIIVLAAQKSGNPAAMALAPVLPRILAAAKRLLPRRTRKAELL